MVDYCNLMLYQIHILGIAKPLLVIRKTSSRTQFISVMSLKIVIALFAVVSLGAVAVHGLKCYDNARRSVTCSVNTAQDTVHYMERYYNVSAINTYPKYSCLSLNQTFSKFI